VIELSDEHTNSGLSRKITVMRHILLQVRIVIIMDTHHFVDCWDIAQLLELYNPGCTLIKIWNNMEVAYDVDRVIMFEHLKLIEQGRPEQLAK
jgi:ABC-type histidine transport system ATPase subunit